LSTDNTVAFRKERAAGAVDQARDQDLVVAQATFALEKAAWNATGGVSFLDVIHAEREEVDAWARLHGSADRHEHHGLATGHQH
jgi:hypothetical protein